MKTGQTYCKEKKRRDIFGKKRNLNIVGKKLCIIKTENLSHISEVVVPEKV